MRFLTSESGAVTVDWVVLTADTVGIGMAMMGVVSDAVEGLSRDIACAIEGTGVRTSFAPRDLIEQDFARCIGGITSPGDGAFVLADGPGSDGRPGYLRFEDQPGPDFALLSRTVGDQSALYGGTISWNIKMIEGEAEALTAGRLPDLRIVGADGRTLTHTAGALAGTDWTRFESRVTAEAGWKVDGSDATEADIRAVLADVESTGIRVEQTIHDPYEIVGVDDVRVTPG
jgi:hypothetical protein